MIQEIRFTIFLFAAVAASVAGCEPSPEVKFRFNQVEWVRQERLNLEDGEHYDDKYKREVGSILTALFGTPDDPTFPLPARNRLFAAEYNFPGPEWIRRRSG